jgi:tRNA modification GTPase
VDESADMVERLGIERSRELLAQADLVLYVIDGACFMPGEHAPPDAVTVWNKADIAGPPPEAGMLAVSAKTAAGLPELCARIAVCLTAKAGVRGAGLSGTEQETAGIGSERQKRLVDAAITGLRQTLALAETGEPLDLIAPALRTAIDSLGEISGEVTHADILESIFSQFCVGK